jgi:hypothetical protein
MPAGYGRSIRSTACSNESTTASDTEVPVDTLDKRMLTQKVGRLPAEALRNVDAGIRLVLAL